MSVALSGYHSRLGSQFLPPLATSHFELFPWWPWKRQLQKKKDKNNGKEIDMYLYNDKEIEISNP